METVLPLGLKVMGKTGFTMQPKAMKRYDMRIDTPSCVWAFQFFAQLQLCSLFSTAKRMPASDSCRKSIRQFVFFPVLSLSPLLLHVMIARQASHSVGGSFHGSASLFPYSTQSSFAASVRFHQRRTINKAAARRAPADLFVHVRCVHHDIKTTSQYAAS